MELFDDAKVQHYFELHNSFSNKNHFLANFFARASKMGYHIHDSTRNIETQQ